MGTHVQKAGFWRRHIREFQVSGLSQNEFCRRRQLKAHRLSYWLGKLGDEKEAAVEARSKFVAVEVAARLAPPPVATRGATGLRVVLPDGTAVEAAADVDVAAVAALTALLRGRAS